MDLADATGIPAATLQYHPDAFPTSHPLALGPLGRNGWSSANRAMPQADLVVAIGAHLDIFSTQFKHGIISKDARIVHHSQSPSDVGMVFPVTHGLTGSTSSFIRGLTDRLVAGGQRWTWTSVDKFPGGMGLRAPGHRRPHRAPDFAARGSSCHARGSTGNGAIILDAGNAGKHMRTFMDTYQPDTFQYISDWGSVGAGLPIAMGVKGPQRIERLWRPSGIWA